MNQRDSQTRSSKSDSRLVRRLCSAAAILALCLATVHLVRYYRLRAWRIKFVQETTGVKWPPGISELRLAGGSAPYGQAWISGHLRIGQEHLQDFTMRHGFERTDISDLSFVFGLDRWPERYDAVQNSEQLHLLTGRTAAKFPFEMLLDAKNGSLWFNVVYPR